MWLWLAAIPLLAAPTVDPSESALAEYVPQAAPDPHPPPYTLVRYTERYDYLADPRNAVDAFDPAKYIALDASHPQRYLSFGGEIRERFESVHNAGFGVDPDDHNVSHLLQRIVVGADLHATERARLFVQAISGVQFGERDTAPAVNEDPLDLQQAFADYTFGDVTGSGERLTVRAGRFEMTYGSGRLIATRAATNVPLKFDGGALIAASGASRIYAFWTRPVRESRNHFDNDDTGQMFWGAYAVSPIGAISADFYYLGFRDEDAHYASGDGTELRQTIGSRWSGGSRSFSFDWEPMIQFGTFAGRQILAWTLATDTAYTFSIAGKPRLGLKADVASGDRGDAGGRFGAFNPLYFKAGYFNDASLLRPTNIVDVHPSLQLEAARSLTVTISSDAVWRYSRGDGVYGPSGRLELPAGGSSNYVGTTAEAALQWKIDRHLVLASSYAHFFVDRYVHESGGADVDYLGTWLTFTW